MAESPHDRSSSNTAIVAIVVILLIAVVAFMIFFWNGAEPEAPADGPDIELQIDPPGNGGGDGGDSPANGEGDESANGENSNP